MKPTTHIKDITKTCLYNFEPLKPHLYIVKLVFTRVYIIFLISAQKHRLWILENHLAEAVLTSTHNLCFEQIYEKYIFVVYSTRRFVVCLSVCHFVLVFFSPFSIAITSLGEERANLSAFRTFVRFVLV